MISTHIQVYRATLAHKCLFFFYFILDKHRCAHEVWLQSYSTRPLGRYRNNCYDKRFAIGGCPAIGDDDTMDHPTRARFAALLAGCLLFLLGMYNTSSASVAIATWFTAHTIDTWTCFGCVYCGDHRLQHLIRRLAVVNLPKQTDLRDTCLSELPAELV